MNLDTQIIENKGELMNYILKQTNRDWELSNDLYQDLFIKVRKTIANGKYVEEGKLIHWLKRIARNLVIDHYRRDGRMKMYSGSRNLQTDINGVPGFDILQVMSAYDEPYEDTWVTDAQADALQKAIETLPIKQQELIDMRYYRNMSYKEIVKETGEKQENLLPRMFYAMKRLKKELC